MVTVELMPEANIPNIIIMMFTVSLNGCCSPLNDIEKKMQPIPEKFGIENGR